MMYRQDSVEPKRLLRVLKKTSMFRALKLEQAKKLLGICEIRNYRAGEVLYKEASPSKEMFMLLSGRLAVRKGGRAVIAEITPVDLIGEMGVITGQVRSAQVVVMEDSMGLTLRKDRLNILLKQDVELDRKILKNIIGILCQKIREDGARLEEYEYVVAHLEQQMISHRSDGGTPCSGAETVQTRAPGSEMRGNGFI